MRRSSRSSREPEDRVTEPIDALEAESARAQAFLAGLSHDDWQRPTRCQPMNVRELAVHAMRGAYRIVEFLGTPVRDAEPEKDAVTYFRYDPVAVGVGVVSRAQEESAARPADADLASEWETVWKQALEAARAAAEDDPVIASPLGTLRLREYIRTRCVEVTIHMMDLADALGREADPSPEGLETACDVLRGLLGTDLRPLGMVDTRFALVGTGRGELTAAEREMLGPLSDSFPLLQ
jgi:uncharacterized protein (TIGR03083 family)